MIKKHNIQSLPMAFNINDHPGKFCCRMVPIHSGVRNLEGMGICKVKVQGSLERKKRLRIEIESATTKQYRIMKNNDSNIYSLANGFKPCRQTKSEPMWYPQFCCWRW